MILGVSNLSKSFLNEPILTDISFQMEAGDKVGLIGMNGAGKTTLFKILNEELSADAGEIYKIKNMRMAYLKQEVQIDSGLCLYDWMEAVFAPLKKIEAQMRDLENEMQSADEKTLEQIMERYHNLSEKFESGRGYTYRSEIRGVLKGLGFGEEVFDRPVVGFSGGEKSRIELARIILQQPDLILLDEPTNHLDIAAINFLESFCRDFKKAMMIISHDRYFLDRTVNRIFHLENHRLKIYEDNYTGFMKQRKTYLAIRQKTYENQQKELKRQEEIVKKFMSYGNKRLIRQGQSRKKLLEKMSFEEKWTPEHSGMGFTLSPALRSGDDVLKVKELAKSFGERSLFKDASFEIYRGEKVGLIGPNGVGKTSLFKILMGQLSPDDGDYDIGENVHIAYFDQERKDLNEDNTVIDEIWDAFPKLTHFEIRSALARMNFIGDDIFKCIDELSGGERARLSFLKMMLQSSNFLLMDEPTNHLDIESKEILEDALLSYDGTVLVISHDRYFLNRVIDKLLVLEPNGVRVFLGNFDYYQEKIKEELDDEKDMPATKTELKKTNIKKRREKQEEKKRKLEIEAVENEIQTLETAVDQIYQRISEAYAENPNFNPIEDHQKIAEYQTQLERLYRSWEALQE